MANDGDETFLIREANSCLDATDKQHGETSKHSTSTIDQASKLSSGDKTSSGLPALASVQWSKDNNLPVFSTVVQPLLNGLAITEDEHRHQSKQLRHEIIHFLDRIARFTMGVHGAASRTIRKMCVVAQG
ncbi:uncharacterized protein LOC125756251 [Rhipicephalus sanguineus]|uniref:uncharacterized protein LOC125756251 n=1 Tax=Rhipicephalus sanguineus TaxID=34632 RepID=UPI0020C3D6EE|nr:uncharacterized protein LOC125756251 [Rhipicephalus sanguineus]